MSWYENLSQKLYDFGETLYGIGNAPVSKEGLVIGGLALVVALTSAGCQDMQGNSKSQIRSAMENTLTTDPDEKDKVFVGTNELSEVSRVVSEIASKWNKPLYKGPIKK